MKKNYIILAHHNPAQLELLIKRLNDGLSFFYVHIDLKSNIKEFENIRCMTNVTLVKNRVKRYWGDISIVKATLNCMKEIVDNGTLHYTILLSGQCWPIVDNQVINDYLRKNDSFEHISLRKASEIWPLFHERINYYNFHFGRNKGDCLTLPYFFSKPVVFAKKLFTYSKVNGIPSFIVLKRTFKKRTTTIANHYGGSQWWGMRFETVCKVLDYVEKNNDFMSFHEYTHVPDEVFFHTIINELNNDNSLKIKPSLTYVNWTRKEVTLPVTFTLADFSELKDQVNNNKLFARKFDVNICNQIFDEF